jgi:hypothetical protein
VARGRAPAAGRGAAGTPPRGLAPRPGRTRTAGWAAAASACKCDLVSFRTSDKTRARALWHDQAPRSDSPDMVLNGRQEVRTSQSVGESMKCVPHVARPLPGCELLHSRRRYQAAARHFELAVVAALLAEGSQPRRRDGVQRRCACVLLLKGGEIPAQQARSHHLQTRVQQREHCTFTRHIARPGHKQVPE